jgi:hypothetical protein
MWVRAAIGTVLCVVGAIFIAQGTGAILGSGMSRHGRWAVVGVVAVVIGLVLLGHAVYLRRCRRSSTTEE